MEKSFNILRITRNNILNSIDNLSVDQLNKIPTGFNNNIIWNVAHSLVVQQLLVYRLSNVDVRISEEIIEKYKKGTVSGEHGSREEIEEIKSLLIKTVDWLEEDYEKEIFNEYQEYTTSYNITLKSTDDAVLFNNVHEGLHLGYILAMKKALGI